MKPALQLVAELLSGKRDSQVENSASESKAERLDYCCIRREKMEGIWVWARSGGLFRLSQGPFFNSVHSTSIAVPQMAENQRLYDVTQQHSSAAADTVWKRLPADRLDRWKISRPLSSRSLGKLNRHPTLLNESFHVFVHC
jgi:hypothetical protein